MITTRAGGFEVEHRASGEPARAGGIEVEAGVRRRASANLQLNLARTGCIALARRLDMASRASGGGAALERGGG